MEECYLLKVTLLCGCFSRFSECKNGTKWRKTSHICVAKQQEPF